MLGYFLGLVLWFSPLAIVLWGAVSQVGLDWKLLWILAGSAAGALVFAIAGAALYNWLTWLDDLKTGPPEAGAIGAATGRAIVSLIFMVFFGWIGSGVGAWLATKQVLYL